MRDTFYCNNKMSLTLEMMVKSCENFEEFEKRFSAEFLNEDCRIGSYIDELLCKYDKKASVASVEAMLAPSYVGNIINGKKNNPSRDALLCICFALGANEDEAQYLLKYAGKAPLYVRNRRDVIIWFGLIKSEKLDEVNENLIRRGLAPLYTEK